MPGANLPAPWAGLSGQCRSSMCRIARSEMITRSGDPVAGAVASCPETGRKPTRTTPIVNQRSQRGSGIRRQNRDLLTWYTKSVTVALFAKLLNRQGSVLSAENTCTGNQDIRAGLARDGGRARINPTVHLDMKIKPSPSTKFSRTLDLSH